MVVKMGTSEFITVAKVVGTHGLNGEIKVIPIITPPRMLKKITSLSLLESANSYRELTISSARSGSKGQWVLSIDEIKSIEEAESIKGALLYLPQDQLPQLPKDSYYLADLIGCSVICEGQALGKLVDVLATGGNDVYVIATPSQQQILLPAVKEFVLSVDIVNKVIDVVLPNGLLEL